MNDSLIPIPKTSLEKLLKPVNRLTESCVIRVEGSKLFTICTSVDNSVILYASCKLPIDIQETKLNIINIKKLLNGLHFLGDDGQFILKLFTNNIKCVSKNEETFENNHFIYHLVDDGIIKESPVKVENIANLKFDTEFEISLSKLKQIMSAYTFVSDITKIYFYSNDGKIYADIDDKTLKNVDKVSMIVSDSYTGKPLDSISLKIEVFKNLISSKLPVKVKIVNTDTLKVFVFNAIEEDNIDLTYVVSALAK
jgi:hypothetical protein